jgi:putative tryptophan/tyrosine transport system substrate-binding protein
MKSSSDFRLPIFGFRFRKLSTIFLVLSVAGLTCAFDRVANAQQRLQPRIGVLIAGSMSSPEGLKYLEAFTRGLRDLGYVSGKNIMIEYRSAERKAERLPDLAAELVRLDVSVIVASGVSSTEAAIEATKTIPIVMVTGGDPVSRGFVKSLTRPGGNVTGMSSVAEGGEGKRLELLKDTVPRLSRVAVLNTDKGSSRASTYEQAGKSLAIDTHVFNVYSPDALDGTLKKIAAGHFDGLIIVRHALTLRFAKQIAQFALEQGLPSMAEEDNFVDFGALMVYGRSVPAMWRRTAVFVDKMLKGAKAAELPVEPPPQFELSLNLKTAAKLGIKFPPEILLEAAEVVK